MNWCFVHAAQQKVNPPQAVLCCVFAGFHSMAQANSTNKGTMAAGLHAQNAH